MNNKLSDLNNYLFEQIERLNDHETAGAELEDEIARSKTMALLASQIINAGNLALKAKAYMDEARVEALPECLKDGI